MTQQRAVKTRADLVAGAATEFAEHSYAAASVNRILENTACTKGAMYFHFKSKQELAEAVLDEAASIYAAIGNRWVDEQDIHPLRAIAELVDAAAAAYLAEPALRAEARLSLEPEFLVRRTTKPWEAAASELASRAYELGFLRSDFTAEKVVRVLMTSLAGNRLLASIVPSETAGSIRSGYAESVETVLAAASSPNSAESARTALP